MSQGPSTLGTMITSSTSPISVTSVVRSSRTHGDSSELTRVHSCVSPSSTVLPTLTRPPRAASLRSTGTASSRLPSTMSALAIVSGSLATIFSFDASKKWIIRDGGNGISRTGSGAPTASGLKKSRGLRLGPERYLGPGRGGSRAPPSGVEGRMNPPRAESFVPRGRGGGGEGQKDGIGRVAHVVLHEPFHAPAGVTDLAVQPAIAAGSDQGRMARPAVGFDRQPEVGPREVDLVPAARRELDR